MNHTKPTLYIADREEKLDLETCKRMLNQNGNNYTDEQVSQIRDYLYQLAQLQCAHFKEWLEYQHAQKEEARQKPEAAPIINMQHKNAA